MKMNFPRFDSAISLVTRAFSFSSFLLGYHNDILVFPCLVGQLTFVPSSHPYKWSLLILSSSCSSPSRNLQCCHYHYQIPIAVLRLFFQEVVSGFPTHHCGFELSSFGRGLAFLSLFCLPFCRLCRISFCLGFLVLRFLFPCHMPRFYSDLHYTGQKLQLHSFQCQFCHYLYSTWMHSQIRDFLPSTSFGGCSRLTHILHCRLFIILAFSIIQFRTVIL